MATLIFDIETNDLLDELTTIHCIVTKDAKTGETTRYGPSEIRVGLTALECADKIIGHNIIGFDIPAIQKLYNFKPKGILDTLVCTRVIWPDLRQLDFNKKPKDLISEKYGSHSLESWGIRLGELKGDFGKTTDWSEFTPSMLEYCVQDVQVTKALLELIESKKLNPTCQDLEHRFAEIMFLQERRGFKFDQTKARALYGEMHKRKSQLEEELQVIFPPLEVTGKTPQYYEWTEGLQNKQALTKKEAVDLVYAHGGVTRKAATEMVRPGPPKVKQIPFNPNSGHHIFSRFSDKYGWKPVHYTAGGDAQVDESILRGLSFPEAPLLVEYKRLSKILGYLGDGKAAWIKLEQKGRIHGRINANGAVTGRCTHSKPNMGNVPSTKVPFGKECRSLFGSSLGRLVGWDASGLELRCLAHYMAPYDDGAYVKTVCGPDVHSANQKAAGLPTRDNAKTFIYGFLYGAGNQKIGEIIGRGMKAGGLIKKKFLEGLPALKALRDGVSYVAKDRGWLKGLDGRQLPVHHAHASLNTLLQGCGAVLMKQAGVYQVQILRDIGLLWGKDFAIVGHIHDEYQLEATEECAEIVGRAGVEGLLMAGRKFDFKCPLDATYKIGTDWSMTH